MRQRRLAKLASLNATPSSPKPASESPTPAPAPETPSFSSPSPSNQSQSQQIRITSKPAPKSASPKNPFSQLTSKKTESEDSISVDSGNIRSAKRPTTAVDAEPSEALPVKKAHAATAESLEDWSDRVLSDVFLVTLDEKRKTDVRGTRLTYLPELRTDLEQSGEPVKLSTSSIDVALLEAAKHVPRSKALLDYFLPCWKRVMRASRPSRRPSPEKEAVLHEAKRLCMSNCIFALTMPEYFG